MRLLPAALIVLLTPGCFLAQTYTISTFAGGGLPVNMKATAAAIGTNVVALDKAGNLFFAYEHSVLRMDAVTGILTLAAGNGTPGSSGDNGPATSAQLWSPIAIALDSAGNMYIADAGNRDVRKVSGGIITTVAGNGTNGYSGDDGPATSAQLYFPNGLAVDSSGSLYIADMYNNRIRKVSGGIITTVAGNGTPGYSGDNGPATSAQLYFPGGVAVDPAGNLYIADTYNSCIRKVANGQISTVAGTGTKGYSGDNGPAASAQLWGPYGIAIDSTLNLYVADTGNHRIRKVSGGSINTVAGNGVFLGNYQDNVPATSTSMSSPQGIAVDAAGNVYVAVPLQSCIRKISSGMIVTVAGRGSFNGDGGPASSAIMNQPTGVAVGAAGTVYIADTSHGLIRKVAAGIVTTVAGGGSSLGENIAATAAQLGQPSGVAVDTAGNLYIATGSIRMVSGGAVTTVAGGGKTGLGDNGPATSAQMSATGVAIDSTGNLYIADSGNNRIRKVSGGIITTVAGTGTAGYSGDNGPATSAQLNIPFGVALDSAGNLYIADTYNSRIRKVSNGIITTVAGTGDWGYGGDNGLATNALLGLPRGVSLDSAGNLYIVDEDCVVRKVSKGIITSIAGTGTIHGFSGDGGVATNAGLYQPRGIAADPAGSHIYIADWADDRIRVLTPSPLPAISHSGIGPIYSTASVIQPGSWISIFGTNLASGTFVWNGDFPTSLGGTSVTINGKLAYLWYVSPTQINLQAPDDTATGLVNVVVTTTTGSATSTVTLQPYGPSFSLLGDGRHVAGVILTPKGGGAYGGGSYDLAGPSGAFSFNTRPVKAGEAVMLYGVGFGPTTPRVAAGQPFSGAAATSSPVTITIGAVKATVQFAGITAAGLYQFNLIVPQNTGSGDKAVQATVNGVQTPAGPLLAVQ